MNKIKSIIGILGGMCSGKSSVAKEFGNLGCAIIDADKIAHELFKENTVKNAIEDTFGKGVFDKKGQVDRNRLREIVFESAENVSKINSILHPLVLAKCQCQITALSADKKVKAIVLDIPLLVETGWNDLCDKLVFVACEEDLRVSRAEKRVFRFSW